MPRLILKRRGLKLCEAIARLHGARRVLLKALWMRRIVLRLVLALRQWDGVRIEWELDAMTCHYAR